MLCFMGGSNLRSLSSAMEFCPNGVRRTRINCSERYCERVVGGLFDCRSFRPPDSFQAPYHVVHTNHLLVEITGKWSKIANKFAFVSTAVIKITRRPLTTIQRTQKSRPIDPSQKKQNQEVSTICIVAPAFMTWFPSPKCRHNEINYFKPISKVS